MTEPKITCPNCSTAITITDSLVAPLLTKTRQEYEKRLSLKDQDILQQQEKINAEKAQIQQTKQNLDTEIAKRLDTERQKISAEETKKAQTASAQELQKKASELNDLKALFEQQNKKLTEAQKTEADFLKQKRLLDDEKRELELTIEKRVQHSITEVRSKAKKEAEDQLQLKVTEKEEQITAMQRQIEALKRKAEQGSQQLQGEALELQLEETLKTKFPFDAIEPVPKGEFGGDVIQRVASTNGAAGTILWESKRTKNWSDTWLPKLRNDQRTAKAEISVIISTTLPKDLESFDQRDGVWIASPRYALPLAIALRQTLIEVSNSKQAQQGQQTKMEMVYEYLTGPRFRHRIEAIVEKFSDMQTDLDKERKAMTRLWAKRETQIQAVIESTVGMYGDFQGIAGRALQQIEGLEMPLLEDITVS